DGLLRGRCSVATTGDGVDDVGRTIAHSGNHTIDIHGGDGLIAAAPSARPTSEHHTIGGEVGGGTDADIRVAGHGSDGGVRGDRDGLLRGRCSVATTGDGVDDVGGARVHSGDDTIGNHGGDGLIAAAPSAHPTSEHHTI